MRKSNNKIISWDTPLDSKYGKIGTAKRANFERLAKDFIILELAEDDNIKSANKKYYLH